MSKQRPDTERLSNELAGASAFFKRGGEPRPIEDASPEPTPQLNPVNSAPEPPRPPVRVARRSMVRHPFELYLDQIERLREAARIEKEQGGAGSMSKMVRDAIDRLLEEHERQ